MGAHRNLDRAGVMLADKDNEGRAVLWCGEGAKLDDVDLLILVSLRVGLG